MNGINLFWVTDLKTWATDNTTCIDGKWTPARPIGRYTKLRHRLSCAWMVFTGKADVVKWYKQ